MSCKIGIVGFGIVGKSLIHFFNSIVPSLAQSHEKLKNFLYPASVCVWDERPLEEQEKSFLLSRSIAYANPNTESLESFMHTNDYIVLSPGFDSRKYTAYKNKFICELDLFAPLFKKPTIALTGTVGKTSTVRLLHEITKIIPYKYQNQQWQPLAFSCGGNIGRGMLECLEEQSKLDGCILELSSFQLEHAKYFAPDIAIWTTFYANHIDRHGTFEAYFKAKTNLFRYQKSHQLAMVPSALFLNPLYTSLNVQEYLGAAKKCIIHPRTLSTAERTLLSSISDTIFYLEGKDVVLYNNNQQSLLLSLDCFPSITYGENFLFIVATLFLLGYDFSFFKEPLYQMRLHNELKLDEHRLECCGTFNGIEFYNDSKSTIAEATYAALTHLSGLGKNIILIIGGINRAKNRIDYLPLFQSVPKLKKIMCFGKECSTFASLESYDTLRDVFDHAVKYAQHGDCILFSPNGASIDLYANYMQRGDVFKILVKEYGNTHTCSQT